MTGGGLLALVAYGSQNVILSGNPQMTQFQKVFKRYTHFSMESATLPLEGPNELGQDAPIKLRAKIQRIGDLVTDMQFTFRVPDIFSKQIQPDPNGRTSQQEFKWVRGLGAALIQNAAFFVGGQKIQEFDGSQIMSRAMLDSDTDTYAKWQTLVGDVEELTAPENGVYAGGSQAQGQPTVIRDPTQSNAAQLNRPSIFAQDIHVPLPFWFSENTSQALPLVGLQQHECEVQLTLNPIENLQTQLDMSGYRVAPGYTMNAATAEITANLPEQSQVIDMSGQFRAFATDIGATPPTLNTWFFNPRIECTQVQLPDGERSTFASKQLSQLFHQVTAQTFPGMYTRQILDLETHNPVTRLVIVPRRSDWIARNDFINWSNWWNYPAAPFVPTPTLPPQLTNTSSSGILLPQGQVDIVRSLRVLADGNEIQEQKPTSFFTKMTPQRRIRGMTGSRIPVQSFSLESPSTQPCGSLNTSRIRNFQLEMDVWPLPPSTTYTQDVTVYVESLNFFEVASGLGGLKQAL